MSITWGSSKNGIKIGIEWRSIATPTHDTTSVTVYADVYIYRAVNIVDSVNNLSWSGSAVTDGSDSNINVGGSGTKKIKTISGTHSLNYGSTQSKSCSVSFSGINYAGGTLYVSKSVTVPARPYGVPAAPTSCTVTRVSDTQHTVAWTNNPNSPDSGHPYQYLYLERWDNVSGVWTQLQQLGATIASFSDTTTVADREYQYRVRSWNSAGYSGYATSSATKTTPAAPTFCTATKEVADIEVAWDDVASAEDGFEVWHAADGVWDGSALATVAAGVTTYTHTAPSASVTHKYRVRAKVNSPALTSAYSPDSNTIQLLTNPLAPTILDPVGGYFDATAARVFSHQHNPADGTAQTAYEYQYRVVGAGSWTSTGKLTSTAGEHSFAGGTFTNGNDYEFQVRTWGQYAVEPSASPWSATGTFSTSAKPTVTLDSPANAGTVTTGTVTAEWTYSDTEATAQAAAVLTLYTAADAVLETVEVTGAADTQAMSTVLADATTYKLGVTVQDGHGIWSAEDVNTFATDFLPPSTPTVTVEWSPDTGSANVTVTNPAPGAGEVAAVSNQLWRSLDEGDSWQLIADGLTTNTTAPDYLPSVSGPTLYKAVAVSATPTSAESATASLEPTYGIGQWLYLNAGPEFSTVARARGNPAVEATIGRERELHHFAGRPDPVEFLGEARTHTLALSALLEPEFANSTQAAFAAVNQAGAPVCYRDRRGRRVFCSIGDVRLLDAAQGHQAFAATLTEVDYDE